MFPTGSHNGTQLAPPLGHVKESEATFCASLNISLSVIFVTAFAHVRPCVWVMKFEACLLAIN